jgi:hypothetical protein
MPQLSLQQINLGGYANDGTGDDLRTAFSKVIANFTTIKEAIPSRVSEDTNPSLGANLNLNGKNLFSNDNVTLTLPSNKHFEVNRTIKAPLLEGKVSDISNHNLDALSDVTVSNPISGQSLVYDGDFWVSGTVIATFTTVDGGASSTIYMTEPSYVIDGGYA